MREGKWLQPRHASPEALERDYPQTDFSALEVYCPGCKALVMLSRKSPNGRVAGWCKKCQRGICP